jgi:hypothetical protein
MAAIRMTKGMKDSIVRRILGDLPVVDYAEIARAEILEAAIKALPQPIRAAWKDPKLQPFINIEHLYSDCGGITAAVPAPNGANRRQGDTVVGGEAWAAFKARCGDKTKQQAERQALARSLDANLADVRTVAAFVERFPELAGYAPAEDEKPSNLPATTALIDSLAAAGLPAAKKDPE